MTKHTPKVAVITRTKDRALLLERAIVSVHNQSMKDFVHVIINDAGEKKTVDDLVKKYASLIDGRVKIIHNPTSHGMEFASNTAIKSVDSIYVAIHDDDDTWHPDFLLKTTEHLDKTGAKGVVVTTDKIEEEIKSDKVEKLSQSRWLPGVTEISLYKQCLDNYATPITFIYRREVYDTIGYYDEQLPVTGDWDFALRFLYHFDIDFLNTEVALAYYHHRPKVTGVNGNTVFAQADMHRHFVNQLLNKYLREDLREGKQGLGYIMNDLRQQHEARGSLIKYIDEQVVRLEGHVNYIGSQLETHVDHEIEELKRQTLKSHVSRLKRRISGE